MNTRPQQSTRARPEDDRRRKELALIHVGARKIGMTRPEYRTMIENIGGAASGSSKDLTAKGRRAVIDHLKSLGFKPEHKSAKKSGMHIPPAADRQPQLSKIGALLADMDLPWSYADAIAKKMFGIERVRWLYSGQLQKVITSLIVYQRRQG